MSDATPAQATPSAPAPIPEASPEPIPEPAPDAIPAIGDLVRLPTGSTIEVFGIRRTMATGAVSVMDRHRVWHEI